ncbi:hypothetical protein ACFQ09_06980 [Massilia norwichensis]|uniref:Chemotaxis protein n=1 Tax=Massilia norwichensis TaxID=1442366 RepID=A0ABT2A925_9BURK|nr:hypothetical protein [Massilia norwichensis]MCS0590696.1 hypothetical protein [Massilia norwichensis]
MENEPSQDEATAAAPEVLNVTPAPTTADPDPPAPANLDDVIEQENRLDGLSALLGQVDSHVSAAYDKLLGASDDDTDAPYTSALAESKVEIDQAYELEAQANKIVQKEQLTNEDLETLESIIDDLDAKIDSATPLTFDPNEGSDDSLLQLDTLAH